MKPLARERDFELKTEISRIGIAFYDLTSLGLIKCKLLHRTTGHWRIEWSKWIPFMVCDKCHKKYMTDLRNSFVSSDC